MRRFDERYKPQPRPVDHDRITLSDKQKAVLDAFARFDPSPMTDREIHFQLADKTMKLSTVRSRISELLTMEALIHARPGTDKYTRRRVRRCRVNPTLLK